ncbi:MAG: hypothetical protein K8T91_18130 [Planctomycetes bacterium]|nr:hypothetical protein [Planctomycetota bacterium]
MAKSIPKHGTKRGAPQSSGGATRAWVIGGVALLLVLLSSFAALAYFRSSEDPKLAELRQLDKEIEAIQKRDDLQPDDMLVIQALSVVRDEKFEALSDEQHAVLRQKQDEQRDKWEEQQDERTSQRLAAFFAMPQAERLASVDKMIETSEAFRKTMEENGAAGGGPPGGRPPVAGGAAPGGGPPGAAGRGGRGGADAQRATGGRRGGNSTPEQRKQRERNRLNRTTPEYRAQRTEFVRVVQARRKELGLQPAPMRQIFGMYRQLAPPTAPSPGGQASPTRS